MNELTRLVNCRPVTLPPRPPLAARLQILGYLSSGTYGRVYKARVRQPSSGASPAMVGTPLSGSTVGTPGKRPREVEDDAQLCAIKKFKPDKEGEAITYTGISQSACREIMINREISHEHVAALRDVILEDKSIYLIFEYAEHDFLQIIHHHSSTRTSLPVPVLKSLLWQLLNGVAYLHDNWIIHRDLKPANILVTSTGQVKIGDLGLARLYQEPLQPLYTSDKIVVTVWYRSPELLLGARHYTPSIDLWSMGCIFGELLGLRPMFKGEEAKVEVGGERGKKGGVPFQKDQMGRVIEVLGNIDKAMWPGVAQLPEYSQLAKYERLPNTLWAWYSSRVPRNAPTNLGFELLKALLTYDPTKRLTARDSLVHPWWSEAPKPHANAFLGLPAGVSYPMRRVTHDESDPQLSAAGPAAPNKSSFANSVGSGIPFPSAARGKRARLD